MSTDTDRGTGSGEGLIQVWRHDGPVGIADALRRHVWDGHLWRLSGRGEWLMWSGGRWHGLSEEDLESVIWAQGRRLWERRQRADGSVAGGPIRMDRTLVGDVVSAMRAVARCPWSRMPVWADGSGCSGGDWDPGFCVGWSDVVVSVSGGVFRVRPRGPEWLDRVVVPCEWGSGPDGSEESGLWGRVVRDWSQGDPLWVEVLRRWMGYCLISDRRWGRWLLMQGRSRAGKGVICHVIRHLVGSEMYGSVGMEDLGGEFGLEGLSGVRVLSVPEWSSGRGVDRATRILKSLVGEDVVTVNRKYERIVRVQIGAAVMVSSNAMPSMPNQNEGLSSKMLVLPFLRSFLGREQDPTLKERLVGDVAEFRRIGLWAMEGARRLVSDGGFPVEECEAASDLRLRFRVLNNPLDAFLEARFVRDGGKWVPLSMVWDEWERFREENGITGNRYNRYTFGVRLEDESTWGLRRSRRRMADGTVVRAIEGMALKKSPESVL